MERARQETSSIAGDPATAAFLVKVKQLRAPLGEAEDPWEARVGWQEKRPANGDSDRLKALEGTRNDHERARELREWLGSSQAPGPSSLSTVVDKDLSIPTGAVPVAAGQEHPFLRGVTTSPRAETAERAKGASREEEMAICLHGKLVWHAKVSQDGKRLLSRPPLGEAVEVPTGEEGSVHEVRVFISPEGEEETQRGSNEVEEPISLEERRRIAREAVPRGVGPPALGMQPLSPPATEMHVQVEIAASEGFAASKMFVRWMLVWGQRRWSWSTERVSRRQHAERGQALEQAPEPGKGRMRGATQAVSAQGSGLVAALSGGERVFATGSTLPQLSLKAGSDPNDVPGGAQPHLLLACYWVDDWGRSGVVGYGRLPLGYQIPSGRSQHAVETYRPAGTPWQRWKSRFVGGSKAVRDARALLSPDWSSLIGAHTEASGRVHVRVDKIVHCRKSRDAAEQEERSTLRRAHWRMSAEADEVRSQNRRARGLHRERTVDDTLQRARKAREQKSLRSASSAGT